MKKWLLRISKAIKTGRFSLEYGSRAWYGRQIYVQPLFCSYGQMGYTISVNYGKAGTLKYDFEMETLKYIFEGSSVDLWAENSGEILEALEAIIND